LKVLTKAAAAVKKYSKRVEYYKKRLGEMDSRLPWKLANGGSCCPKRHR
jgi:hypothetical protein